MGLAFAMMMDMETRAKYQGKGPERAKLFTWERAMERWKALLEVKVAV